MKHVLGWLLVLCVVLSGVAFAGGTYYSSTNPDGSVSVTYPNGAMGSFRTDFYGNVTGTISDPPFPEEKLELTMPPPTPSPDREKYMKDAAERNKEKESAASQVNVSRKAYVDPKYKELVEKDEMKCITDSSGNTICVRK